MKARIRQVRRTAAEMRQCPRGFHVEVWSYKDEKGDVVLYTSDYLSQNMWTINHPPEERQLDEHIYDVRVEYAYDHVTLERILKEAAHRAWPEVEFAA